MRQRDSGPNQYEISAAGNSLKATCNLPFGPKRSRFGLAALLIALSVLISCGTWLWPKAYGHGNWWYLAHHYTMLDFDDALIGTAVGFLSLLAGIRYLCPAGAVLICDRSQVTTTRIPWYCFTGRWVTHMYNASEVSGFRLKLFDSRSGGTVY